MTSIRPRYAALVLGCALAAGPALGQAAHQAKQTPPIQMGTSGGSINDKLLFLACCGGTLGALVNYDGAHHILSNNHVVARSGQAANGEDIAQPALIDSGCSATTSNIVADYVGNLVPLGSTNVDAALARVRPGQVDTSGAILGIGVPCAATQNATVGLPVRKAGRTTGVTTGTVQAVNVSTNVQYQRGCGFGIPFVVSFTNQISITPGTFSTGGDSGSLILSDDGTPNPVGLLFAGSSAATLANPIASVVSAFTAGGHTFSFVGSACASPDEAVGGDKLLGLPESELQFAKSVQARHEKDLFRLPNVIGVGVGKTEDKADSRDAVLILYVQSRPGMLLVDEGYPAEMDGLKVRVIPTDPFVAY